MLRYPICDVGISSRLTVAPQGRVPHRRARAGVQGLHHGVANDSVPCGCGDGDRVGSGEGVVNQAQVSRKAVA